jgi:hypothetical protein
MIVEPLRVRIGFALRQDPRRVADVPHARPGPVRRGRDRRHPADALIDPGERHRDVTARRHPARRHVPGAEFRGRPVGHAQRIQRRLAEDRPHVPAEAAENPGSDLLAGLGPALAMLPQIETDRGKAATS